MKCKRTQDVYFPSNAVENRISCECGGVAHRVWLKAPGVVKETLGYYDVQLGKHIESRSQLNRELKERGLIALGPDEQRRTISQGHSENPGDGWDDAKFKDAFDKAYSDAVHGRLPNVEPDAAPDAPIAGVTPDAA